MPEHEAEVVLVFTLKDGRAFRASITDCTPHLVRLMFKLLREDVHKRLAWPEPTGTE